MPFQERENGFLVAMERRTGGGVAYWIARHSAMDNQYAPKAGESVDEPERPSALRVPKRTSRGPRQVIGLSVPGFGLRRELEARRGKRVRDLPNQQTYALRRTGSRGQFLEQKVTERIDPGDAATAPDKS
jgi:hypothetical protein